MSESASACMRHPFERGAAHCRSCVSAYCAECLVFPDGPTADPLCISCALEIAGVKSTSSSSHLRGSRKDRKIARKERRAQARERDAFSEVAARHSLVPAVGDVGDLAPAQDEIQWVSS